MNIPSLQIHVPHVRHHGHFREIEWLTLMLMLMLFPMAAVVVVFVLVVVAVAVTATVAGENLQVFSARYCLCESEMMAAQSPELATLKWMMLQPILVTKEMLLLLPNFGEDDDVLSSSSFVSSWFCDATV